MQIHDKARMRGKVNYKCYGPDGLLKWEHNTPENTLTELMDVMVADAISGGEDPLILYAHLGTGTGQDAADTNLAAPCEEVRTGPDSTTQGEGAADNDIVYVFTFAATVCTASIEEAGLFSAEAYATADMKAYDSTISKEKEAADALVLTWTLSFGAS